MEMDMMQTFDPKKRITVEEALAHPYLEAYVRIFHRSVHITANHHDLYRISIAVVIYFTYHITTA